MCAERVLRASGSSDIERESDEYTRVSYTEGSENNSLVKSMELSTIQATKLMKHPTHHGNMTGEAAEEALRKRGAPSYLIRFSEIRQKHVLSLATSENKFEHYGLSEENYRYTLDGTDKIFSSIDKLLEYYEAVPIDPTRPNTIIGKDMGMERQKAYPRREPLQTIREEPTQAEVMQSLLESNKELIKLLQERCAKQDEMLEKMSRKSCNIS